MRLLLAAHGTFMRKQQLCFGAGKMRRHAASTPDAETPAETANLVHTIGIAFEAEVLAKEKVGGLGDVGVIVVEKSYTNWCTDS